MTATHSWAKVHYELRPAKQVERRMLVESFRRLGQDGFPISEYVYIGMGSIHFIDYTMFYRYLGIKKLKSAEYDFDAQQRAVYNRPFAAIDVYSGAVADLIDTMNRDDHHLLWLDYDGPLDRSHIQDVFSAVANARGGSILLITIDAEPIRDSSDGNRIYDSHATMEHYANHASRFLSPNYAQNDFSRNSLPTTLLGILDRIFSSAAADIPKLDFFPLFAFQYADGHRMITYGGMVCDDLSRDKLRSGSAVSDSWVRQSVAGGLYEIKVPVVTRRERLLLDSVMPCQNDWQPAEFIMSSAEIWQYREIHRFYPSFAELYL
jgi:hypothetical protein